MRKIAFKEIEMFDADKKIISSTSNDLRRVEL
jgi:hypothetical protein